MDDQKRLLHNSMFREEEHTNPAAAPASYTHSWASTTAPAGRAQLIFIYRLVGQQSRLVMYTMLGPFHQHAMEKKKGEESEPNDAD